LPFAIQFSHALEKHEYSVCKGQNIAHLHHHKADCSIFHYQVNYSTIDFSSNFTTIENVSTEERIYAAEDQNSSIKLHHKSSRAPPILLL